MTQMSPARSASTAEIKRLAFDALDIKVYASRDKTEIRGVIPLESLPTIAQTSAQPRGCRNLSYTLSQKVNCQAETLL